MRRARFKREAKAIAALDHPNIVQVFSVEEAEGIHFITMQLVHGKTLTELLPKNGFPLNKFFEIAIPLADAVAAAHQEGITHRDLKPDNMMVGEDGRIKVLDFGLAKPTSGFVGGDAESALPTAAKTAQGVIVGTSCRPSRRWDSPSTLGQLFFSLGIIFYEMVTGRRPFGGDNPASVLSAIIKDDPRSLAELDPELPRDLVKIVRRCLAKELLRRFQSAIDLRNDLEELKQDVASGELSAPVIRKTSRGPIVALTLVAIAAIAVVVVLLLSGDLIPRFTNPAQVTSDLGLEDYPTWSPEGSRIAYHSNRSGNFDVWVVQVSGGNPVNLTPDSPSNDLYPSWSPDGNLIAFASDREGHGCYVIPALGGKPRKVSTIEARPWRRPQWSTNSSALACASRDETGSFAEIVTLSTQESRRVPLSGALQPHDLSWSPDGKLFALVDAVGNAQTGQVWVTRVADGEAYPVTDVLSEDWSPSWSPDGRSFYFVSNRGGSMDLWRQAVGPDGHPGGDPEPVTAGVGLRRGVLHADGKKFAYSKGRRVANLWRIPILTDRRATWADAEQLTFDQAYVESLDVSHDGERLVLNSNRGGYIDLWTMPVEGGEMEQVTMDISPDWHPSWSPDGEEIAFQGFRAGNRDIWVVPARGGPARQLTQHESSDQVPAWSPEGNQIAFHARRGGGVQVWLVPSGGGDPRPIARGYLASWSPDGQWIAFTSNQDGTTRVWRIAANGEGEPHPVTRTEVHHRSYWSRDGTAIYFLGRSDIWVVSLEDEAERRLTDLRGKRGMLGVYALATDGQYLYFTWQDDPGDIWVMDVVTDEDS